MKTEEMIPVVFSPENEPYLGRPLLFHFDQIVSSALEQSNQTITPLKAKKLSGSQKMAYQVISQAVSIVLSIRELVRQGYLFGAHVLVRPFVERAAILLYLHLHPDEIAKWESGWNYGDAPSLSKMFDAIQEGLNRVSSIPGGKMTSSMNTLLHAKPDSALWNMVIDNSGDVGQAVSKILNRPDLCDELCANVIPWVAVVQSMAAAYFPDSLDEA